MIRFSGKYVPCKSCTVCGKKPSLISKWVGEEHRWWLTCYCGIVYPKDYPFYAKSKAEAIEAWNSNN